MFLNAASPRRSFSIPVNINLHGARRRQTREVFHTAATQQDWSRRADGRGGQAARTQRPVSSVGEDRAVLLGFTMMAFSVLMFFVIGVTTVKPHVNSCWKEISCVLVETVILDEWVDCRGVSKVPCLRATVNLTGSDSAAFLHYDEEPVLHGSECFYIPKCQTDKRALDDEARKLKSDLDVYLERNSTCFREAVQQYDNRTILVLHQRYTLSRALRGLLWPCLMLGGGALLVGLVKLTQCLAHLSSELSSDTAGRLTSRHAQGKLYRLLRGSSAPPPHDVSSWDRGGNTGQGSESEKY